MNWSDERYVRLYTRDSATWLTWTWEARAVFCLLLRKVDRAGVLDTGRRDQTQALALLLDVPGDVAGRVLPQWLADDTVVRTPTALFLPHFVEAQEAAQSDATRQRESREKRRAAVTAQIVEAACHTPSQPVTPAVPSQPCRTVESLPLAPLAAESVNDDGDLFPLDLPPAPKPKPAEKPADPRHAPLVAQLVATYADVLGAPYAFERVDAKHVTALLARARDPTEADARWRLALERSRNPYQANKVRTLSDLVRHWNHYPVALEAS